MATHQTAPTQFAFVNGVKLAYRRIGKRDGTPLIFLPHLRGTMDLVDPLLINSIAKTREVILFDDSGVGHSEGKISETLQQSAATAVGLLKAIGVPKVDILGFSLGGMTGQIIAVEHTELVNKLVLAGTQGSWTEGLAFGGPEISEIASSAIPSEEDMMKLFFFPSDTSRALGHQWWERRKERRVPGETPTDFLDQAGGAAQQAAIGKFVSDPSFFPRLTQVNIPVLITNGVNDVMTPTSNSFILVQRLRNAELQIYPDSGHAHLYQFPEKYAIHLELFLDS